MKAIRNYDADYFITSSGDISDEGTIKRYAIEIQNDSGDVVEYMSFDSENNAQDFINQFKPLNK